jgi:NADH-quinone oxidoreductase subunit J
MESIFFYIFAGIAVLAAIGVVLQQRVFYAAVSLIVCLSAIAGIYMLLDSPFIAAVQIIVYAGAIMVMFLFVIMLLDPFSTSSTRDKKKSLSLFAIVLGAVALVLLYGLIESYDPALAPKTPLSGSPAGAGALHQIGETLFNQYLLPFEITSILILVAIIGVVVLARRQA